MAKGYNLNLSHAARHPTYFCMGQALRIALFNALTSLYIRLSWFVVRLVVDTLSDDPVGGFMLTKPGILQLFAIKSGR